MVLPLAAEGKTASPSRRLTIATERPFGASLPMADWMRLFFSAGEDGAEVYVSPSR